MSDPCFPDYYDYPKRICMESQNKIGPDGFCGPHRPPSDMSAEKDMKAGEPSYPTAWAYEQVCKARTKWQERAEAAEAAAKRLALKVLAARDDGDEMAVVACASEVLADLPGPEAAPIADPITERWHEPPTHDELRAALDSAARHLGAAAVLLRTNFPDTATLMAAEAKIARAIATGRG